MKIFLAPIFFLILHFTLPCRAQSPEPYDVDVFHAQTVYSLRTLNHYLQFGEDNETHAITYINWCPDNGGLLYGREPYRCDEEGDTWITLMERLIGFSKKYYRAMFMVMNPSTFKRLLTDQTYILSITNFDTVWFGVRLLNGTNNDASDESDGKFITWPPLLITHKVAMMFNERPLEPGQANPGYSHALLARLKGLQPLPNVNYIGLEATYLAATAPKTALEIFTPEDRLIIYRLDGQPMPDCRRLRNIVEQLKARVKTVQLYIDRKIVDRMASYIPNLDWTQIPTQMYRDKYVNPLAFYDHLAEGDAFPLTHMRVWFSGGEHYLTERNTAREDRTLHVPLKWLLMQLNARYAIL